MKTQAARINLFWNIGAVSLMALSAAAQTPDSPETAIPSSTPSATAPAKLPYGVDEVLKLSRAQISEDITLNYVQNSGTIYNLSAKDIVYLRNEGVSDKVINTMLDQRKNVPADVANQNALQAQAAAAAVAAAPASPEMGFAPGAPVYAQPQPIYVQPAPVYVQPEPQTAPASTLYIIPYGPSGGNYYRYPSLYFGGSYGCPSSVYTVNAGYGGGRYYSASRSGRGPRGGRR